MQENISCMINRIFSFFFFIYFSNVALKIQRFGACQYYAHSQVALVYSFE